MSSEEVKVIALVENLELAVPKKLPSKAPIPRIIEISDRDKKLELKRQLNIDNGNNKTFNEFDEDRESIEILKRLPPGTVLIKQLDSSDLIRNSNDNNTMIIEQLDDPEKSFDKTRKLSQRIKNKKATHEVRRNPKRDKKFDLQNDRINSRQRLLSTKRKNLSINETKKNNFNYMNTRSVTRKMYNVGATYQAPTKKDETEWRDWPVHGMHERPVFHPQIGLVAEYNGRLFEIIDGEGYREISEEEQIEIVTVDPRVDSLDRPIFKKKLENLPNDQAVPLPKLPNFLDPKDSSVIKRILRLDYSRQQAEILRSMTNNYEKLQQVENLRRHRSQTRLLNFESSQGSAPAEIGIGLQNKAFAENHLNSSQYVPRITPHPISLSSNGLHDFPNNRKLYFLRTPERPHTATSILKNSKLKSTWSDFEMKNRLNHSMAPDMNNFNYPRPVLERREAAGSYYSHMPMPTLRQKTLPTETITSRYALTEDYVRMTPIALTTSNRNNENNFEVLDLSKKNKIKEISLGTADTNKLKNCPTNLVSYFKNFDANENMENMDCYEDSKILS